MLLGDVNSVAKNITPEINKAIKNIELVFEQSMIDGLPIELQESYKNLIIQDKSTRLSKLNKASDDICALIESEKEYNLGNFEFKDAYQQCRKRVDYWANEFECVSWFCVNFLQSVNQTIDSQLSKD